MIQEKQLLVAKVNEYKTIPFEKLAIRLKSGKDRVDSYKVADESGAKYQIEVSIEWENAPDSICVIGFINGNKPWWKQFVSTTSVSSTIDSKNQIKD